MIKLVDPWQQHAEIENELVEIFKESLKSSAFIGGKPVSVFEESFAKFCNSQFAVGVSNGTAALEIALRASGVKKGDEVITVANTFFATVEAIYNVGAIPKFVDITLNDGLMDINLISEAVSPRTTAIVPVHLFGNLVNIHELAKIASKLNLRIIEDAAQAHGAIANWGNIAQFSDSAAFSFYPGKNLGALGDAGAVVTNNGDIKDFMSKIRDHGRVSKYEHDYIGTNARLDALQASFLTVKLRKIPEWNQRRGRIAANYLNGLSSGGFHVLNDSDSYSSAWHLFVVRVKNRDSVMKYMSNNGIETGIHYPIPLHRQPAIRDYFKDLVLPNTEKLSGEIMSLPIHPFLTERNVETILKLFLDVAIPIRI